MPRRARRKLLYDGCLADVISRSIETKRIFEKEEEFEVFRKILLESRDKHGFKVHHYCLMNTHFHLAVRIPSVEAFGAGMKWAKREYTNWYNWRTKRRGTLWQERYKSLLIENALYLVACGGYIENNPVEAGLVNRAAEWKYSSSRHYEKKAKDVLVDAYERQSDELPVLSEEMFEKGDGIGSKLFQIHLKEEMISVP